MLMIFIIGIRFLFPLSILFSVKIGDYTKNSCTFVAENIKSTNYKKGQPYEKVQFVATRDGSSNML